MAPVGIMGVRRGHMILDITL
jgi:hypothetical protein